MISPLVRPVESLLKIAAIITQPRICLQSTNSDLQSTLRPRLVDRTCSLEKKHCLSLRLRPNFTLRRLETSSVQNRQTRQGLVTNLTACTLQDYTMCWSIYKAKVKSHIISTNKQGRYAVLLEIKRLFGHYVDTA